MIRVAEIILMMFGATVLMGYLGYALDRYDHIKNSTAAKVTATIDDEKRSRIEAGAQRACGENAAWELLPDGFTVQCYTKRGFKTELTAKVQL